MDSAIGIQNYFDSLILCNYNAVLNLEIELFYIFEAIVCTCFLPLLNNCVRINIIQ